MPLGMGGWRETQYPTGRAEGVQAGGEKAEGRALGTPGLCGSEDQAKGVRSCLDLPRWRPLVLAAALPAMLASWRWGAVFYIRECLLLSLE